MSNPLARIPSVRKKRRKAKAEKGAKIGGPALAAVVAGAVAVLLRRKKKSGQPDADRAAAAQTEAATQDADKAVVESDNGAGADSLGATLGAAGVAPEGSVTPDVGAEDPIVREETNAAAAEAGAIGSEPDQPA